MTGAVLQETLIEASARGQRFIDLPWEDVVVEWLVDQGYEIFNIDDEFVRVTWRQCEY